MEKTGGERERKRKGAAEAEVPKEEIVDRSGVCVCTREIEIGRKGENRLRKKSRLNIRVRNCKAERESVCNPALFCPCG